METSITHSYMQTPCRTQIQSKPAAAAATAPADPCPPPNPTQYLKPPKTPCKRRHVHDHICRSRLSTSAWVWSASRNALSPQPLLGHTTSQHWCVFASLSTRTLTKTCQPVRKACTYRAAQVLGPRICAVKQLVESRVEVFTSCTCKAGWPAHTKPVHA